MSRNVEKTRHSARSAAGTAARDAGADAPSAAKRPHFLNVPGQPGHSGQLQTINLHKSYRKGAVEVPVLRGVSLNVRQAEFLAIVGQSGSGKSTLLHLLGTLDAPDDGEIHYAGQRIDDLPVRARDHLRNCRFGMIFQFYHLLPELTTLENVLTPLMIAHGAWSYFRHRSEHRDRAKTLLEMVGLSERANERVEGYSRGMKQRLHIARGLIHDPEILFLDEPTVGLDPVAAREQRKVITDLKKAGKTIFLTSHYMFEMDALCDRVAILNKGRIIIVDTPSSLKSLVADLEIVEIECFGATDACIDALRAHPTVVAVHVEPLDQTQLLQIQAPAGTELVQEFLKLLADVQIKKVVTRQPTLEDAYVKLVGQDSTRA